MAGVDAAANRAYEALRGQIMRWELTPGVALRELDLAADLGMSRTPVREAIQRLRSEGLLATRGRKGVEVPRWNLQDLDDSYRLRANLEAIAARMTSQRPENLPFEHLHSLADQMTELGRHDKPDLERLAELNIEFHRAIRAAAGSERVVDTVTTVVHLPLLHRIFHVYTRQEMDATLQEHHTILAALESGDAEWVESISRAHILAALACLKGPNGIFVGDGS